MAEAQPGQEPRSPGSRSLSRRPPCPLPGTPSGRGWWPRGAGKSEGFPVTGGRAKAGTLQSGSRGAPCSARGRGWMCGTAASGDLGSLPVPGQLKEEGPARSRYGTSPAQDSPPQSLPKGNSPTTRCSKNSSTVTSVVTGTCHSHQGARCSPGTGLRWQWPPVQEKTLVCPTPAGSDRRQSPFWDRPVLLSHFTSQETEAGGLATC